MKKKSWFVLKAEEWWNSSIWWKIGTAIVALIVFSIIRWIWNLGFVQDIRQTVSGWLSGLLPKE